MQTPLDCPSRALAQSGGEPPNEEPLPLSVVIPVFNEAGNLAVLVEEIYAALTTVHRFEVVIVDDASTDGSADEIAALCLTDGCVRAFSHSHNRGQSAALATGIRGARGRIIATLDGDGQNDPADIPDMLALLSIHSSNVLIAGERLRRQDKWLRRLSSRIANHVRSTVLKDGTRDTGCGLKVFFRDAYLSLPEFDHMHRFLPALFVRHGGAVVTVPVNHRPRRLGVSKYGIANRMWVGIIDLLGVWWLQQRRL